MGKGSLTFSDGTVLDLDYHFPDIKTVALSMSGGVESAALVLLLQKFYGYDNVFVFSGHIEGRRAWEAENAAKLSKHIGVKYFQVIKDNFQFMTPPENKRMRILANQYTQFDGWFNGANKLLFAPTSILKQEVKDYVRNEKVYMPFMGLLKQHTIEIFYMLGREDVLAKTFSCTVKGDTHCGNCYCCLERARGFAVLGEKDQATYDIEWEDILKQCFFSDHRFNKNW
jgi:7-cyano-7-deazaguanine synthase in queuosine biosynthesis